MVRVARHFRRSLVLAALLLLTGVAAAQQPAPARQPASKAAAILTWPAAAREKYIAALDTFFLTRTVKAGRHPHALAGGRPLKAFAAGGPRSDAFELFLSTQRVRG